MTSIEPPARASGASSSRCSARCWLARLLRADAVGGGAIGVRVECNVPDATRLDRRRPGRHDRELEGRGRQIRAGFHRIEVRHPGYYSFFQEVELPGGSHVVVTAKLRELVE